MLLKNKISLKWYVFGTLVNLAWPQAFLDDFPISIHIVFMGCLFINQFFLLLWGAKMLNIPLKSNYIPGWLLGILKLFVLIFGFYYTLSAFPRGTLFLVLIYIFQLIILVLSTKRL